jgi:hypothetical protein
VRKGIVSFKLLQLHLSSRKEHMKTKTAIATECDAHPKHLNTHEAPAAFPPNFATRRRMFRGPTHHRQRPHITNMANLVLTLVCIVLLASCATHDLTSFAEASKALSTSVNTGGDLAIKPLARMPLWANGNLVQPDDPSHPSKALEASWEGRRKAMEAVLVYSASLAAINEASAHRKENAAELVGSVKQLASAVPSLGVGASAAGDLVVFGLGVYTEIKAWHDMRQAVQAADPAIQLVAKALKLDFTELSNEFESKQRDQIIQKVNALRPVVRVHQALQKQRDIQRTRVADAPSDTTLGAELARLDGLIAAVEVDLNKLQSEKGKIEAALAEGKEFFATTIKAIDAWASAHADLVKSFEQERPPNLALLGAHRGTQGDR